jgi:hypothetical protein
MFVAAMNLNGGVMAALTGYTNVYDTALTILVQKGYQMWYVESTKTYWG